MAQPDRADDQGCMSRLAKRAARMKVAPNGFKSLATGHAAGLIVQVDALWLFRRYML